MMHAASGPNAGVGGVNPAQVGLGVQLGAINTNFAQGSAQNTGRPTDLMIQGDGFFVLKNGNSEQYTRAGAFSFDTTGTLVNPEGMRVQGWTGTAGVVNTNGATGDITLPAGTIIPPQASANVVVAGNIQPDPNAASDILTLGQTVYDASGAAHPLTITLTGDGAGNYTASVTDANDPGGTFSDPGATLAFDPITGQLTGTPVTDAVVLPDGTTTVTIDFSAMTRFGGPKSANVKSADGYPAGSLQGFQISGDGSVTGVFSNGQKLLVAKVALAGFNNPMGLEKAGNSTYRSTTNSGNPQINVPGTGGVGSLLAGAVEMSNVDLASEFTNLIIAQRGFQANSRVITTSDQMLQDLVDIKR
jgi:flagellar hook protein FlgE